MILQAASPEENERLQAFLADKSDHTVQLLEHFVTQYQIIGNVSLRPAKSMVAIAAPGKSMAWVTQLGKNFVHIVFPFKEAFTDNMCFIKIAPVPGDAHQFNHHFRMYQKEDVNNEVRKFMRLAYQG
jgi:hypothetical protein